MAAPVNVSPGGQNTHHVKLSLNSTDLGLILCNRNGDIDPLAYHPSPTNSALQIRQGDQSYQDEAEPWSLKSQDDWSGGRGSKNIDKALNKYLDGTRIDSTNPGTILPSGFDSYGVYGTLSQYWKGCSPQNFGVQSLSFDSTIHYWGMPFKLSSGFTSAYVWLWVKATGTPGTLTVALCSNHASNYPSTVLASSTVTYASVDNHGWNLVVLPIAYAFSSATEYWLRFSDPSASGSGSWRVLAGTETFSYSGSNTIMEDSDGASWSSSYYQYSPYYRIVPARDDFAAHYFEYKGALYAALNYKDGGVSSLFMEGDQGVVKNTPTPTTTTCTLDSGTATWAADEAIGSIFMIVAGTGSNQHKPFALITDNGATSGGETSLTFDALDVAPGSDSEIVIVGSQKWTEITGHGWAAGEQVTGVLSVNHAVYFAMGDSVVMSRMRRYNSAGAWTTQWQDETGQFTHLEWANDQDGQYVWGAKGGYPSTVAKAPSIDCSGTGAASALTFESALNTGDVGKRARSLTKYGEFANLHIMKEDNVMQVVPDDVIVPVGLAQMGMASDYRNGVASVVHKGYLYWSYHNTILRYYDGFLDNSGPSTADVGVPDDRLGVCEKLISYEDKLIALYNGGSNNYSTVMVYNGQGWCEFYRSPSVGMEIRGGTIQPLPGNNVDRLYFSCGSELVNMPIAPKPASYPIENYYHYYAFGVGCRLELSSNYFGKQDALKLYTGLKAIIEPTDAAPTVGSVFVDYRTDDSETWVVPYEYQITDFRNVISFASDYSLVANRINLRLCWDGSRTDAPAALISLVLRALVQQDVNEYVDLTALIEDNGMSLLEDTPDSYSSADLKVTQIKTWAASPQPPLFRWHDSLLDNKYYKIDAPSVRATSILDELSGQMKHVLAMRVYLVE